MPYLPSQREVSPMNYFSHYFFFRQTATPYRTIGMILPDIARFSTGKKPFRDIAVIGSEGREFVEIFEGCSLHYKADHLFHGSEIFQEMSAGITTLLKENNFDYGAMRRWFFDHVFTELIFDRYLIRKYNDPIQEFYNLLTQVDGKKVVRFLELYGRTNLENFAYYFERFCSTRFLVSYTNDQSFVQSLNRTMQKVEQSPVVFEQLQPLLLPCEHFVATFEQRIQILMHE